jgi:prolyl oligopeptidase
MPRSPDDTHTTTIPPLFQHLVDAGWTSSSKLVIQGGSNGGLLVAACANQRPDLFACVLAQVGVMDMLRFQKFTIGHAWITDYGNPEKKEDFPVLFSYSPIHNVRRPADGGQYPAFMVTTGDHDDRVVPLHSHKLTATLQHVMGGEGSPQRNPIITRVDVRAGHGAGKPTDKVIAEVADMFGFAAGVVGAAWCDPEEV